jgi:hypothetical protein
MAIRRPRSIIGAYLLPTEMVLIADFVRMHLHQPKSM